MATATTNGKAKCFECNKNKIVYLCEGCSQKFCLTDLTEHQQQHGKELDKILTDCDEFRQKLIEQKGDQNQRLLIQQVNEWEDNSMKRIKQIAEECRQILIKHTDDNIMEIEKELNKFITDLKQIRRENDFNEFHLNQLKMELEKLEKELDQPSNISIQQHSTPFINKISVSVMSNIQANAQWVQDGVTVAGGHGAGDATNQLHEPFGVFIDDDQTMVIADTWNHRIIQWKMDDTHGQVVAGGHGAGNRLDQLNYPTDVLVDKETNGLIICDRQNRRVVRWSRRIYTTQGEILLNNISCFGLAIDNQRYLYISDTENHEVRRYRIGDNNGTLVAGGHGLGNDLNQLNFPTYLFVDRQQAVYVSDNENYRVMKWNKGATEGIVVVGGQGQGKALTQLSNPSGLFVDTLGTIYVADLGNDRVMRWPTENALGIGRDGLTLIFEDSFDSGSRLNGSIWSPNYPWGTIYNHRANMDRRQVTISNNQVNLTALAMRSTSTMNIDTADYGLVDLDYTSGAIYTNSRISLTRGLVVVRMQVPPVTSTWPMIMLVPTDQTLPMLTMDIFDDRKNVGYSFQYTSSSGSRASVSGTARSLTDNSKDMHSYSIDWGYDKVTFFYDNITLRSFVQSNELTQITEMRLILALGVGGRSPSISSSNTTDYPQSLLIDSVEMWSPKYDGRYTMINLKSNLSFEVKSGQTQDRALIVQNNYTGVAWQQWDINYIGNSYYKIINVHSRKVVDVHDWQTDDNAKIIQYKFNLKENQIWRIMEHDDQTVSFVNVWSQKVASIINGSTQVDAQIVQRTFDNGLDQKWKVIRLN
ncbi:unnamed protein product [Rotaria sordida]|uniref:GH16 domain-containing protein n=1 Tax=Rotaria sordida TaxID=392033 RepID=A0A814SE89_9BILA|nr:unnamed protein product [Rotaria sordida]CAF1381385.1 unnamed protein product [Rotaria sordida]